MVHNFNMWKYPAQFRNVTNGGWSAGTKTQGQDFRKRIISVSIKSVQGMGKH